MLTLPPPINKRRKRLRPRIEELRDRGCEIDIQALVANKPGAIHTVFDHFGNRLDFVDELFRDQMALAVYVNNVRYQTFPIAERAIPGRINNHVPADKKFFYYVVVDGQRFKKLYVDLSNGKIGSRKTLGATYTCDSVGPKQEDTWRECRKLWKERAWRWRR